MGYFAEYDKRKDKKYGVKDILKIKKSDLIKANNTIDDTIGFLIAFLDFADDDQIKFVDNLIDDLRDIQDNVIKVKE